MKQHQPCPLPKQEDLEVCEFKRPFKAEMDTDGVTGIWDADNHGICSFNRYTQIPLDDNLALAEEAMRWFRFAEWMCIKMNRGVST